MKTRIVLFILFSLVASLAFGAGDDNQGQNIQGQHDWAHSQPLDRGHELWQDPGHELWQDPGHERRALSAPELDPGQAASALLLLSGTLAILRGYRRKK
jgi:hypothetical protein